MYLKKLKIIKHNQELIREVSFHKGLNLIVGYPELDKKGTTTNSLGKTTALRVIDFCLGGTIQQLYLDSENRTKNVKVYNFLYENNLSFILIVEKNNLEISIERIINLSRKKNKIVNKIDSSFYSNDAFKVNLSKILFDNNEEKPSCRQLMPKFIRKDETQISNILKYLHNTTTAETYETIHCFLFGFNNPKLLNKKLTIEEKISALDKQDKVLTQQYKKYELEQVLPILKNEIEELKN